MFFLLRTILSFWNSFKLNFRFFPKTNIKIEGLFFLKVKFIFLTLYSLFSKVDVLLIILISKSW